MRFNFPEYLKRLNDASERVVVGLAGKYMGPRDTYASIHAALEHAGCACGVKVEVVDIPTDAIELADAGASRVASAARHLAAMDGIIVPGGFGERGWEGKIACITHARASGLPLLGICYGFQAAMVEYARACCDMAGANSTENDATTTDPVVCLLPEQYEIEGIGGSMRLGRHDVSLLRGSRVAGLYGGLQAHERFRHRYEFNPLYRKAFEDSGMVFSGWAPGQSIVQIAELSDHPYFIGTQFHPEFTSRPARPNPLFHGFVAACGAHRRTHRRAAAHGAASVAGAVSDLRAGGRTNGSAPDGANGEASSSGNSACSERAMARDAGAPPANKGHSENAAVAARTSAGAHVVTGAHAAAGGGAETGTSARRRGRAGSAGPHAPRAGAGQTGGGAMRSTQSMGSTQCR